MFRLYFSHRQVNCDRKLHERRNNLEQNEYTNVQQDAEIQYYSPVIYDRCAFRDERMDLIEDKIINLRSRIELRFKIPRTVKCNQICSEMSQCKTTNMNIPGDAKLNRLSNWR
jgi:hypothetical protein